MIAVAVVAGDKAQAQGPYVGKQVDVNVDIRCLPGNEVSINLKPWNVPLAIGDSVAWILNKDASVADITIMPKDPKDAKKWPYDDSPPYKGNAAKGPKLRKMKSTVKVGDRYSYNVSAVCQRADGSLNNIVIDPDMIIIPGGG